MNAVALGMLTVFVSAGGTPAAENPVLTDLVNKGVTMPDGEVVKLPPPLMAEGLTRAQQAAVLKHEAPRGDVLEFTGTRSNAPVSLKMFRQPRRKAAT